MAKADSREVFEARLAAGLVCQRHPKYKGLRKPRTDCEECFAIYHARLDRGVTEIRHRERGRNDRYRQGLSRNGVSSNAVIVVSGRVEDTTHHDALYGLITASLTARNLDVHLDDDGQYAAQRRADGLE